MWLQLVRDEGYEWLDSVLRHLLRHPLKIETLSFHDGVALRLAQLLVDASLRRICYFKVLFGLVRCWNFSVVFVRVSLGSCWIQTFIALYGPDTRRVDEGF